MTDDMDVELAKEYAQRISKSVSQAMRCMSIPNKDWDGYRRCMKRVSTLARIAEKLR